MILLPDEQKQLFSAVVDDILTERGSAIYLTDALAYAERAVVAALLNGKSEITLDLGHVVQTAEAQREVKAIFKEYAADFFSDLGMEAIDKDIYPDVKN
ncbi:transcriptional regulator [Parasutterella excrementihominis]|uniref:transcriptional regulator n=1 Tax=Parasutterella excrementihominis TaxID=487175 RepID=UPI003A92B8F7